MIKKILALLICLSFFYVTASVCLAAEGTTRIIVFDLKNKTEDPELGKQIADMARVIIPEFKGFEVIDRGIMRAKVSQNNMNIDEITDSGSGFEAVKLFDSDYFIVGDIGKLVNIFSLNIKLVDSKTGSIIKAEGLEFENLLEVRKIIRGLLSDVLNYGRVSGKPIINEEEFNKAKKDPSLALSISIGSTIIQTAAFGYTLSLDQSTDTLLPRSLALMIPPMTSLYTNDWSLAPITIGFSVGAGVFTYIGYTLVYDENNDTFAKLFGTALIIMGGSAKIYSVASDILNSTSSVEKYNNALKEKYFIAESFQVVPLIQGDAVGLKLVCNY